MACLANGKHSQATFFNAATLCDFTFPYAYVTSPVLKHPQRLGDRYPLHANLLREKVVRER